MMCCLYGWIDWTNDYPLELRLKASCKSGTSYITDHSANPIFSLRQYGLQSNHASLPFGFAGAGVRFDRFKTFFDNHYTNCHDNIIVRAVSLPDQTIKHALYNLHITQNHAKSMKSVDHPIANKHTCMDMMDIWLDLLVIHNHAYVWYIYIYDICIVYYCIIYNPCAMMSPCWGMVVVTPNENLFDFWKHLAKLGCMS